VCNRTDRNPLIDNPPYPPIGKPGKAHDPRRGLYLRKRVGGGTLLHDDLIGSVEMLRLTLRPRCLDHHLEFEDDRESAPA